MKRCINADCTGKICKYAKNMTEILWTGNEKRFRAKFMRPESCNCDEIFYSAISRSPQ